MYTGNASSEESGYYFGIALYQHRPMLPTGASQQECAKEALFWKRRYSWLNTELFAKAAIETYEGEQAIKGGI